jgi:hypothetical protein
LEKEFRILKNGGKLISRDLDWDALKNWYLVVLGEKMII